MKITRIKRTISGTSTYARDDGKLEMTADVEDGEDPIRATLELDAILDSTMEQITEQSRIRDRLKKDLAAKSMKQAYDTAIPSGLKAAQRAMNSSWSDAISNIGKMLPPATLDAFYAEKIKLIYESMPKMGPSSIGEEEPPK